MRVLLILVSMLLSSCDQVQHKSLDCWKMAEVAVETTDQKDADLSQIETEASLAIVKRMEQQRIGDRTNGGDFYGWCRAMEAGNWRSNQL